MLQIKRIGYFEIAANPKAARLSFNIMSLQALSRMLR